MRWRSARLGCTVPTVERAVSSLFAVIAPIIVAVACGSPPPPELGTPSSAARPVERPPERAEPVRPDPIVEPDERSECPPDMRKVPGGLLWLGSPEGAGRDDERPSTKIDVAPFCLDATEVTVAEVKACVANAICTEPVLTLEKVKPGAKKLPEPDPQCTLAREGADDLPINCVDVAEATRYCKWKGRRLPTEPEHEFAATSGEDKVTHPWGDTPPDANNSCFARKEGPCRIKSVPPAAYGLYDIVGNLSEWTSTPYGKYGAQASGTEHVVRGASWKSKSPDDARGKRRFSRAPTERDFLVGFRCAKSL